MKFSWQQLSQVFKEYLSSRHDELEEAVEDGVDLYRGLSPLALYTTLEDIRLIQSHPAVTGTWVDLGAGIGQTVLSYLCLHPNRKAMGYEKSSARVLAGRKIFNGLGVNPDILRHGDLLTEDLSQGDTYFLYFPTGMVLDRVLEELQRKPFFKLVAIESHGDLFPRLAHEPGLRLLAEIELSSLRHHPRARIFEKIPRSSQKLELFKRSFKRDYLIVSEGMEEWIGETEGAEWMEGIRFNLKTPPRTISHDEISQFYQEEDLCSLTIFLTELRRRGEISVLTEEGRLTGEVRKIYLKPSFCLELSGGQKVKWEEIKEITLKGHRCYDSFSPSSFLLPVV